MARGLYAFLFKPIDSDDTEFSAVVGRDSDLYQSLDITCIHIGESDMLFRHALLPQDLRIPGEVWSLFSGTAISSDYGM